jgi:L-seryl-tRNA(Ser) seleniumtransferase
MVKTHNDQLRKLPSVDSILSLPETAGLVETHGRPETARVVRTTLASLRETISSGVTVPQPDMQAQAIVSKVARTLEEQDQRILRRAVNATGIVLHTGLGRAPMAESVHQHLIDAAGTCTLQVNLDTGRRGRRENCILDLVRRITGAEDAALVNNNAGATLLVLRALAAGREVVISRGELIEIGGSFRLPDIMAESGAVLREVGTTNKTHLRDYEQAVSPKTGLLMKAHKSNYRIEGFSKEVAIGDIVAVGKKHGIPVVDDLGAGALLDMRQFGLPHEPTVQESVAAGADVVLFSTDKLIGGPQGGLIIGRKILVDRIRSQPLYRALRVCKLTLAALESTLRLFTAPDLLTGRHPLYRMIARQSAELDEQAARIAANVAVMKPGWQVKTVPHQAFLGGGSLPEEAMPSVAVALSAPGVRADDLARALRGNPGAAVVPCIQDDCVLLDMRTVLPEEVDAVILAIKDCKPSQAHVP